MDDKTKMLEGQLGKEKLSELAGLATKCFIIKKEDFEKQPRQPYINKEGNLVTFIGEGKNKMEWEHREKLMGEMWHEVPLVDSSITAYVPSDSIAGQDTSQRKFRDHFGFTGTLMVESVEQKRYQAQLLAATVLPVFSKSMLPITLPHTPFQLRDSYTKRYRNPHNFFYSAMGNIYSPFLRKESEEEEQLFEKLETALNLCNLRSIRFRSQLFHHWL